MTGNKTIKTGTSVATAILVLGVIHVIATFTPLVRVGLTCLSPGQLGVVTFFSLVCGSSFIMSGLLLILMLKNLEQHRFLNLPCMVIGIFLAVSSILSVAYMMTNPFAWISLILNLAMFIIILQLRKA